MSKLVSHKEYLNWEPLKGYEGKYEICERGIRNAKNKRMKFLFLMHGYVKVYLVPRDNKFFHRLLAIQYIPNPENKPEINHKNGIKTDNRLENLEWVTMFENLRHASLMKLTEEEVIAIRASDKSLRELSAIYKVRTDHIWRLKNRQNWKHI